ncbi:MAG: hypothetical protein EXQ67_07680 [Thermoleophilia bacterium]|nr:hypothetical protein [Thermoleophilia bacterium]
MQATGRVNARQGDVGTANTHPSVYTFHNADHKPALYPYLTVSHFHIKTPFGYRPVSEFSYGGEVRPPLAPDATDEEAIDHLWLRTNANGVQRERWFHASGTRRWYTIVRDTRTNLVLAQPGEEYQEGSA